MSGQQNYKKDMVKRYYLDQLNQIVDDAILLKDDGVLSEHDLKCLGVLLKIEFEKPIPEWRFEPFSLFKRFKNYRKICI